MSPDVIGMIIALFAFTVTVLGGVAGLLARQSRALEARFDKIDSRFEKIDARFEKVDARFDRIDDRFDRVEGEITDLKVAIARLDGSSPRLQRL